MGKLVPQERLEIFTLGLKRELQVQEICARYDITREIYARITRAGHAALAAAFAPRPMGRPHKDAHLGEAAPLVARLQAELAQAATREQALRGKMRILQAALTMAQRFIRLLAGGRDFTARFVRFSGAEKLQVCRLAWEAKQQGISLQTFARGLGKSYGTLLCWYQLYDPERSDAENVAALTDRESTPARVWNTLDPWVVAVIRRVAQRHPEWGGRQIAWHLRQLKWTHLHVAPSTVYNYLAQWRGPRQGGPNRRNRYCFFRPGAAWCVDYCHLKAGAVKAFLLLVLDDCTRQVVAWHLTTATGTQGVLSTLQAAFHRLGAPLLVKADNGPEFRQAFRAGLAADGVAVLNSPYYCAPFNGKAERAFRALRRFLRYRAPADDLAALQYLVARWVYEHNALMVSESLGQQTPWQAARNPDSVFTAVPGQEVVIPTWHQDGLLLRFRNRKGGQARKVLPLQAA